VEITKIGFIEPDLVRVADQIGTRNINVRPTRVPSRRLLLTLAEHGIPNSIWQTNDGMSRMGNGGEEMKRE
jgi:hypothetical protein